MSPLRDIVDAVTIGQYSFHRDHRHLLEVMARSVARFARIAHFPQEPPFRPAPFVTIRPLAEKTRVGMSASRFTRSFFQLHAIACCLLPLRCPQDDAIGVRDADEQVKEKRQPTGPKNRLIKPTSDSFFPLPANTCNRSTRSIPDSFSIRSALALGSQGKIFLY